MLYTWLFYKKCKQKTNIQKDFYPYLAEKLIDNMYDISGTRQALRISRGETSGYPARNHTLVAENGILRSGAAIYLTPTNKMRRMKVNITKNKQKRVCRDCKKYNTKRICSTSYDNNIEHWICHTDTECSFFANHVENDHENL